VVFARLRRPFRIGGCLPGFDIKLDIYRHRIKMRTTLDIADDILDLAKSVAEARHTSVGKALSWLARRGAKTPAPLSCRNGFSIFQVPDPTTAFGLEDIEAALDAEDRQNSRQFLSPSQPTSR
jgi:hypothetical protein